MFQRFWLAAAITAAIAALLAFPASAEPPRPKVGLVLGGGGARGGAHLGVIQVLEEMRVPVDCIAGTSMGALVGGAYAAGVSPAEIIDLVGRTDWIGIFEDSAGRDSVNLRRKELDDRFYGGIEFGVSREGLKFREGALAGEKLKLFFNELVRSDLGDRNIEDLRMPLAVIATDIGRGTRQVMRSGNLTSAMRGSMSVPGLLAPVLREGAKLVDGGITDNLPVAEVHDLCHPDVVIAVNVGSPLMKPEEVKGIGTVLGQVVNLLTEQNVAASLARLREADIYVKPELGEIHATDFTRQLEAAEAGREAMRAIAPRLAKLSLPPAQYAQWQRHVRLVVPRQPPVVDEIEVAQTRFVNPDTLRTAIGQKEGQPLDADRLAKDLVREYSQGDLQSLDYSVVRERDKTILRISPVEKTWGPDYLRFGLNLASDFRSESSYNLRALYRRTWLDSLGGEWLIGGQIGSQQSVYTEFFQPLDLRHLAFVKPYGAMSLRKVPVYRGSDRLAIYRVQDNRAGIDLGVNFGVRGEATLGWEERHIGAVLDTGPDSFLNSTEQVGGPVAHLAIDTYDQPFFPTRGIKVDVTHFDAQHVADSTNKYSRSEARLGGAVSHGRWTWLGALEGGTTLKGALPLGDAFSLGGPRRLSGFTQGQLLGGDYVFGRLETQYRLHYASPLWGLTLIAGVMAEAGRMNKPFIESSITGTQRSVGGYLAANTFMGPVYLGVSEARNGKGRFYLFIGTP